MLWEAPSLWKCPQAFETDLCAVRSLRSVPWGILLWPIWSQWPTGNHDLWFWDLLKWGLDCASLENAIRFQSSRKRRFPKFILVSTGRVSHRELISRSTRGSESKITVSTYGEGLLLLHHIVENLTLRDRESMVAQSHSSSSGKPIHQPWGLPIYHGGGDHITRQKKHGSTSHSFFYDESIMEILLSYPYPALLTHQRPQLQMPWTYPFGD